MRDADPENEIDDIESPEHGPLEPGDAHSLTKLVSPGREAGGDDRQCGKGREQVSAADPRERPEQVFTDSLVRYKLRRRGHAYLTFCR